MASSDSHDATITLSSSSHISDDELSIQYDFRCDTGVYDVYVHHIAKGPGIFSRAAVQLDQKPQVRFWRYGKIPPVPYWMQVDRVSLAAGPHRLVMRHLPGMGFNPRFEFDRIELRRVATSATDWRWGVTGLYQEGKEAERSLRASLKSVEAVRSYQRRVRMEFAKMLGSIPQERTDLKAMVTGTRQRTGYRIEKVIYQSRPGFYVTALLYLPSDDLIRRPAVLHLPGHHANGKAFRDYQRLCSGLAHKGYVVLSIDPINQGERGPYYTPGNTHEGQGMQGFLAHDLNSGYFIWDGVRALDYLESRPEVDADRLGVTGISGGGVQTMLLAFFDERVKGAVAMGAPQPTEVVLWSSYDPDGTFNDVMRPYGASNEAIVSCIAPRGFVIQSGQRDVGFPASTARELFEQIRPIYEIFGAEEMLVCESPDAIHELNLPMRENVYKWMNRFLEQPDRDNVERGAEVIPDEEIYCTPTGLVESSFEDAESIWSLRLRKAKAQKVAVAMRRALSRKSIDAARQYQADIRTRLVEVLRYRKNKDPLAAEVAAYPSDRAEDPTESVCFTTEAPMRITADLWIPAGGKGKLPAVVYINQTSTNPPEHWAGQMTRRGWAVFSIHARLTPRPDQRFGERVTSAAHGGHYPLGMKLVDLLRGASYLRTRSDIDPARIGYFGDGEYSGLVALFAGLLDERAAQVIADTSLMSFFDLLQQQTPNGYDRKLQEPMFLPGAMKEFDITDLAAALAPVSLMLLAPDSRETWWNGATRPEFDWVHERYKQLGAAESLERSTHDRDDRLDFIANWLAGTGQQ